MPKLYSEDEKNNIRKRLKKEAAACLKLYGIKKTTVDELVRRVNIPKGTFYLFYKSKELLLFEVIMEFHEEIDKEMMEDMTKLIEDFSIESFVDVIFKFYMKAESSYLLRLMTTDDIDILLKKLPQEITKDHLVHDENNVEKIIEMVAKGKEVDIEAISGGFRAIFFSMLYKDALGSDFEETIRTLIRGLVLQIMN